MYVTNEVFTINWEINLTTLSLSPIRSYFDVILTLPDGTSTYLTDPTTGYIAPVHTSTVRTNGNVTYTFTPTHIGLHEIELVTGTSSAYEVLSSSQLYATCLPEDYVSETTVCGIDVNNPLVYCGVPPKELAYSTSGWKNITAIGRHATAGKIILIGWEGTDGSSSHPCDIGELDLATGVITRIHADAMPHATTGNSNWSGIDCDRATGVYTACSSKDFVSYYPAYWSTDLTTWTECTNPSTQFKGNGSIYFDDILGVWFWRLGTSVFSSLDGKTWVNQQKWRMAPFSNEINLAQCYAYMPASENPWGQNVGLWSTAQGAMTEVVPLQSLPISTVPLVSATAETSEVTETVYYNSANWPFDHRIQNIFSGGLVPMPQSGVFVMDNDGQIMKSDVADFSVWTALAEKDSTGTPNGPSNELVDQLSFAPNHFMNWNGTWYLQNSQTFQWKYTGASPDSEPLGYGWSNITSAPEGPWLSQSGNYQRLIGEPMASFNAPWAQIAYDYDILRYIILYDSNFL